MRCRGGKSFRRNALTEFCILVGVSYVTRRVVADRRGCAGTMHHRGRRSRRQDLIASSAQVSGSLSLDSRAIRRDEPHSHLLSLMRSLAPDSACGDRSVSASSTLMGRRDNRAAAKAPIRRSRFPASIHAHRSPFARLDRSRRTRAEAPVPTGASLRESGRAACPTR